jgi:hypothetical protein
MVKVLTCKDCNNSFGSEYQAVLSRLQDLAELRAGTPTKVQRAKAVIEGKSFNARVYRSPDGMLWIQGSTKNNPPEVARYWLSREGQAIQAQAVRLYVKGNLDQNAVERVLIRDAYLLAFHCLGYPYICTSPAQNLRLMLAGDKPVPKGAVWDLPEPPVTADPKAGEFLWVQEPQELASLLVPFDVPVIGRRYVVLPFFPYNWQTYADLCAAWTQASEGEQHVEISLVKTSVAPEAKYSVRLQPVHISEGEVELRLLGHDL